MTTEPPDVSSQAADNPVDKVRHTWAFREHHRFELILVDRDRRAVEQAALRNATGQALAYGGDIVGEPVIEWHPVDQAEAVAWSRVDRDSDSWLIEFGAEGPTEWDVAAEEQRRLEWWLGCRELRVSVTIERDPEQAMTVRLSADAHAAIREQGVGVMRAKANATAICGGALRRHSFAPRDAGWLRDGLIEKAHCNDCDRDVTRDELLERARNEAEHGTCHVDGDAFVLRGAGNSGLICPTCTDALRR